MTPAAAAAARRNHSAAAAIGARVSSKISTEGFGRGPAIASQRSRDAPKIPSASTSTALSLAGAGAGAHQRRSASLGGSGSGSGSGRGVRAAVGGGRLSGAAGVAGKGSGYSSSASASATAQRGGGGGGGGGGRRPWGDVLKLIRQEQDKGSYQRALREIKNGRKTGHWIWFVWPCLQVLRPNTSRPMFLLPDPAAAQDYLKDEVLWCRMKEITEVAVGHLRNGVAPATLFGSLTDAEKFSETMTFFAVAAKENRDQEMANFFLDALDATVKKPGSFAQLDPRTMKALIVSHNLIRYKDAESTSDLR